MDVPLPASHEPNLPLFSVRDSIVDEGNQPKAAFRFVLEENPDGLFRLDANSGELFLQEEAAFGAIPPPRLNGEYELSVRIEQRQADRTELVARRVYTVRLVPMPSHGGATTTTTTASSTSSEEEGIFAADQRTTTAATSTTTKVASPSAAESSTLAEEEEATTDDHRRTRQAHFLGSSFNR